MDLSKPERPFQEWDVGEQALDQLVEGLSIISSPDGTMQIEPPVGWDTGVLVAIEEMGELFERGVEKLDFERKTSRGTLHKASLTRNTREMLSSRVRSTTENTLTVEGRLLMADFEETHRRCRLHPPIGSPITCLFDEEQREIILSLLTRYVRVTGQAIVLEELGRIKAVRISQIEPVSTLESEGYDFWTLRSASELAHAQGIPAIENVATLRANLWDSDEDLQAFLEDTYLARRPGS